MAAPARLVRPVLALLPVSATAAAVLAAGASAAAPASGFVNGTITSVKGPAFVLSTTDVPGGNAKVTLAKNAVVTKQVALEPSALKAGLCATAIGRRGSNGTVAALRLMVASPVKGQCGGGFGGRPPGAGPGRRPPGGARPAGAPPRGGRPPANVGFSAGAITSVKGSTIKLHSNRQGTSTVTVSASTQIAQTKTADASAIDARLCAFVRGTSADKGRTIAAAVVNLTSPGSNGCAGFGFGRR
jgi:hypothetical protein